MASFSRGAPQKVSRASGASVGGLQQGPRLFDCSPFDGTMRNMMNISYLDILAFCLQIAQGLPCISTIINKWLRLRFSRGRLGEHSADMGHMQTFHAWSTYPPVTVENPPLVDHFRLPPWLFHIQKVVFRGL